MSYSATIVADSISEVGYLTPKSNLPSEVTSPHPYRLTTMLVTEPLMIHPEHLRHRSFSYSVASSRAIPITKLIEQALTDPVIPVYWGKNQKGMVATEELTDRQQGKAKRIWLKGRDRAVETARALSDFAYDSGEGSTNPQDYGVGVHKQISNRVLAPYLFTTVLVTGTDQAWSNFFFLRCHPAAQPEMQHTAELMRDAYNASTPVVVRAGEWHLPFIQPQDREEALWKAKAPATSSDAGEGYVSYLDNVADLLKQVSAGRCARTSYLTHLGVRDLSEDVRLHNSLLAGATKSPPEPIHASPLEHQATPLLLGEYARGNLVGWRSYRSTIPGEAGPTASLALAEVQAPTGSTFQPVEAPNV